jgi:hypothetical protein
MPAAHRNQSRTPTGAGALRRLRPKLRRLIAKSWILSRCYYPLRGHRLSGRANDEIWYFAYGANMHDSTFRVRRGIQPLEHRSGRIKGYRLRFNLEGRPSPNFALFLAQTLDIVCSSGVGLSTRWA